MQEEKASLREKKRRATLHAIEDHATRLVCERGYESVTVEDICTAAGVSRRTFFNYVDSKEIAIFGRPARLPPPDAQHRFLHTTHADLVAAVVDTLFDAFVAEHDGQLLRRRKTIRQAHPEIFYARFAQSHEIHQAVAGMVTRYLDAHPQRRRLTCPTEHEAHAVVTLAGAAMQLGMRRWMNGTGNTVEALRGSIHGALDDLTAIEKER
ncbi:TetR family transcriptional regulator [Corynebacterium sp. zg-331]|uniref:TetR/AcrR family transcriptional regulator n=1 Tax=unclassified Corynebacterium TaxID=2624378 RepID=UPI00128E81AD|nr:TetR family transcriptional regulator [Corynebacterium sp. zg-331]